MRDGRGCRGGFREQGLWCSIWTFQTASNWSGRHSSSRSSPDRDNKRTWHADRVSCHFFFDVSRPVGRRPPLWKACALAPPTAASSPSGPLSWSLGSPELSETGREAHHWRARRGCTCRWGGLLDLRLKKKESFVAWIGWKECTYSISHECALLCSWRKMML